MDWDILRYEYLTGVIRDFEPEDLVWLNAGVLPEENGRGDEATWDIKHIRRDIDSFETNHGPANPRALQILGTAHIKMANTFKSKGLVGDLWMNLRDPGTLERQKLMEDQLARELEDWAMLMARQDNFMISQALQGTLSIIVDGITIPIDYGIPTSNKFKYNGGSGFTAFADGLPWSNPAADIITDLKDMKLSISRHSGRTARRMWISSLVMTYLLNNDSVREFVGRSVIGAQMIKDGYISNIMGLDVQVSDETYTDADGNNVTPFLDEKTIVIHPAPDKAWGSMMIGSVAVPTADRLKLAEVVGKAAWSNVEVNPPQLTLYTKYVRLPKIALPAATAKGKVA